MAPPQVRYARSGDINVAYQVIGVQAELAIRQMRTSMPVRFETASGDVRIEGVLVECGDDGRATSCEPVRVSVA